MESFKKAIIFFAGTQGLILSLALIFSGLRRKLANVFLAIILIICSIELLNAWAMTFNYHSRSNNFPFWLIGSYLTLAPALWLFIQFSIFSSFRWRNVYYILFIPAFIEITVEFASLYANRLTGTSYAFTRHGTWLFFTEILPVLCFIAVLVHYWMCLQKMVSSLQLTVKTRSHRLKHYTLFGTFSGLTILWITESFFWLPVFPYTEFFICLLLFALGYIIYFQPSFYETVIAIPEKKANIIFQGYDDEREMNRLTKLMEEDKIYCQPRLSLENLADQLELPVRYVSYLINKNHGANLSHYLNTYRVKEVLKRMEDPAEHNKTLVGIAMDCGFNSKSTFNQFFKTYTGETPSDFFSKIKAVPKT